MAQKPDSLRYELLRSQGPREVNSGHLALWFNFRMAIRRLTVFPWPGQSPSGPSSGLDPSLFIETRDREARNGVAQWATPFCLLKRLEIQLQTQLKHAVRLADSDDSR